ncbi:hypothetical protein P879_02060 [Paragonimus westermani]|uniref:Uncharacterized protein n=1 Tax=Paragonimus westermani TaxID=34504 RepID=A0A8T0DVT8_9TREM|nr:hypothetical protein P879_02060 [Paragonimus westermani]
MNTNCDVLKAILPNLIEKTIYISLECFEKARQDKPLLPLTGVPKYLHASQRSNRPLRASLDGSYGAGRSEPDCRVQGFGLPDGFSLLYNESPAAFRTRWPIAHSNILRGWIVPRYRPSVPGFNEKSHLSTFSLHQMTMSTDALANEPRRNSEMPLQSFGSIAPYRQSFNILTTIDRQPHNQQNITSQSAPSKLMQSMQLNNSPKHRYFECNLRRYPQSHNPTKNTYRTSLTVTDIKLPKPISDLVFEVESTSHCSSLIKVPTPTKPMTQNKPTDAEATDTSDIEVSEPMDDSLRLESLTHRAPETANSTTRQQTQPSQQSSGHITRPTIPMATVKLYSVSNKQSGSINTKVSRPSVKSIVCSIRQDKRSAPVTTYWSQPTSLQTAQKILSSSSSDRMKHKMINSKLQDHPRASLDRGS